MIEINDQGRQVNEAEVALLEQDFGKKIPENYRKFLLLKNGGLPSPDTVDVAGLPGSPTDVQVFFGIGRRVHSSDISWNLRLVHDRFPELKILPIACDSGGNLFCLRALKNEDFDIQYCDMEDNGRLYLVASDFEEFLNKIRPWEH